MEHIHSPSAREANYREQPHFWRRMAPVLGLFFLAPMTAEYLIGYLDSTGNFPVMLAGLSILAPLYGGAALIIREVTRRAGRGWPTIILLSFAFGVLQAGLIDHSLFNSSFQDIEGWEDTLYPTYISTLGISANHALNFIPGHVIWSIGVPIALVETFVPRRRTTPWLGKLGLTITVVLYVLASALIFQDMAQSEQFLPSLPQFIGAAAVVITLIGGAFAVGRQLRPPIDGTIPKPWLVGMVTFMLLNLPTFIEVALEVLGGSPLFMIDWRGAVLNIMLLAVLVVLVWRWSQRKDWRAAHRLAVAGGALLTRA